ncbi:MAG TPA: glycerol-3-phosphate 1-O-acyltransferase PlsY [Nitrospiraceae bacterium]|nr:glycerol-3-phosphate 1-O-acyltransferase PlsY [Nitrospiraceae bacterium]
MMFDEWIPAAMAVGGYLLGSIPFGLVIAKCLGTTDPRTAGSRNIGFTNVLRLSGKTAGLLTLAGDMGKGWLVAWMAAQTFDQEAVIAAIALAPIVGHLYPIFLGFRGGKGVATAMGAVLGMAPLVGVVIIFVWLMTVAVWRYSSGAALVAFFMLPVVSVVFGRGWVFVVFSVVVSSLVVFRHRENMARLWSGTEPKVWSAS